VDRDQSLDCRESKPCSATSSGAISAKRCAFTKNKLFKRDAASIRRPFAGFSGLWRRHIMRFDRDRGGGHPPTPPTPPCLRVRTRRFETFRLTLLEQRRKTTIAEIGIRKRDVQCFRMGEMPWAMTTAGGLSVKSRLGSRKLLIVNELRHGRSAVGVVIVSLLSFPLAETIPVEAIS